jgi:hypothetical protein
MIGGALDAVCPPGFLCMNPPFLLGLIICLAAAVYFFTRKIDYGESQDRKEDMRQQRQERQERQQTVKVIVERAQPMRDPRYPPPPDKNYEMESDTRGFIPPPGVPVIPIQVPTRGLPEEFQQMGVLTAQGGSATSGSPNRTLLPLLGRRVAVSRDRYNYYTRTDGFNPVQVPVSFKNRGCDDDNGCNEIMNGDSIAVPLLGQTFIATIYKNNTPRYIPLI